MSKKADPKSFRQAILREYEKYKDIKKVMDNFQADKYLNRWTIIIWTLRQIGVEIPDKYCVWQGCKE